MPKNSFRQGLKNGKKREEEVMAEKDKGTCGGGCGQGGGHCGQDGCDGTSKKDGSGGHCGGQKPGGCPGCGGHKGGGRDPHGN